VLIFFSFFISLFSSFVMVWHKKSKFELMECMREMPVLELLGAFCFLACYIQQKTDPTQVHSMQHGPFRGIPQRLFRCAISYSFWSHTGRNGEASLWGIAMCISIGDRKMEA
jgi:hypothetical protein